ncbi:MAG: hypothetical protein L3K04_04135 [Thermoplasmata archaeon]|nr:hypothetical protein [Thermoplasmata archaeon]MCI4338405.1 hypothetical protein [Thermoplasmata archaeon]MCI4341084.1 hypothetical protein [Thermoplasmata archaeon]
MSATSSGVLSGIIFGLALAFLLEQLGYLSLSALAAGTLYVVVFAVAFGVVFGIIGNLLGKRRARKLWPAANSA